MLRRYFGKISPLNISVLVGKDGELVIDDTDNSVYIMDGQNPGGFKIFDGHSLQQDLESIDANVTPETNNFYSLGNTSNQWRDVFAANSIVLNGYSLTVNNGNLFVNGNSLQSGGIIENTINANVGSIAPTNLTGSMWFNTIDGRLYVNYNNNWIDANPTVIPPPETYIGNISIDNTTIGTNIVGGSITIDADLIPSANVSYGLGNQDNQWKDLWVSNNTIYINSIPLSIDNSGTLLVNGNIVSGGGSTYGNSNVAAYLPTYAGNISLGNITSGSYSWKFSNDGAITIPGVISTINTSQVGSALGIATNFDGGNVGWSSQALAVVYNADIISTYAVGSTITFQDNTVATITLIDNYGPTYIDIYWDTPKTGVLFPITLKTSNYVAASSANATIVVGTNGNPDVNTWTFGNDGKLTIPTSIAAKHIDTVGNIAVSGEPSYGYGGVLAVFVNGDFSVGAWADVQSGWTVTDGSGFTDTILSVGDPFAGAIKTTSVSWPTTGGKTYTFTSANYVAASANDLVLTANLHTWNFGANSNLTVPSGGKIISGYPSEGILQDVMSFVASSAWIANVSGENAMGVDDYHAEISLGSSVWNFAKNGTLTVPGNISSTAGTGNTVINANDGSTTRTWTFGGNGILSLPTGGNISYMPNTASDWNGTPPVTIQEALDRLAAVVKSLNGGTGA